MIEHILLLAALLFAAPPRWQDPAQATEEHARGALARLCPCRPADDAACLRDHRHVANAIGLVASSDADAVALIGLCAHESGCRDVVQIGGGPAYGPWQVETSRGLRAGLRTDLVAQARWALRAWGAGASTYACGRRAADAPPACSRAAGELRSYVASAWWAWGAAAR